MRYEFIKRTVGVLNNDVPPAQMNTFHTVGDINGDGLKDIVMSGRNGRMVWFENNGTMENWKMHLIDNVEMQECGGCVIDLTHKGYPDVINGGDWRSDELNWWENDGNFEKIWKKHLIVKTGKGQFHDTLIGDVGDGRKSLVFTNQAGGTNVCYIPVPDDPYVSPWPGLKFIAKGMSEDQQPEEGLLLADIDNDGKNEVICGTRWYKYDAKNLSWASHQFAKGYITTKIAVSDVDGDGKNEIILSEGDPCVYGRTEGGKLAYFKPMSNIFGLWEEHLIDDHLLDAHSLRTGDICGNGRADLLVGEVGMADGNTDMYIKRQPALMVYENDGKGNFTRHVIDEGTGSHEAYIADMLNRNTLDIVTKPLHGKEKWNVHVYFRKL